MLWMWTHTGLCPGCNPQITKWGDTDITQDVARDPGKVIEYYTKACQGDYPQSCVKLAKLYQYGKLGVVKDTAKVRA